MPNVESWRIPLDGCIDTARVPQTLRLMNTSQSFTTTVACKTAARRVERNIYMMHLHAIQVETLRKRFYKQKEVL